MSLLSIRSAQPEDAQALHAFAPDSTPPLSGEILVAELDGAVIAAVSLMDGRVVADPHRRSADTVEILRLRARRELRARPVAA